MNQIQTIFGKRLILITITSTIVAIIYLIIARNHELQTGESSLLLYPLAALALSGLASYWLSRYWQYKQATAKKRSE